MRAVTIPSRGSVRNSPIETRRLILAPIEPPDTADLWATIEASRWHLERWLPWVPFNSSPEATYRYAEACASDWDTGKGLRFCVRERGTLELVGVVGLDSCVHLHRSCELGYWLKRDATGKGLMTEAAEACVGFAFSQVGMHRIRCAAATDNYPSLKVIMRLRFRFEGIARQAELVCSRWLDHAVFSRLSSDD